MIVFRCGWKMSQPALQVASKYTDLGAFDVAVTPELVSYLRATLGASSAFNGAAYSPTFLNDDISNAKGEVVYSIPAPPTNSKGYYYATVPSYKVITSNDLRIVLSSNQRVTVQSSGTSATFPVTIVFYRLVGTDCHHDTLKLKPGECRVR